MARSILRRMSETAKPVVIVLACGLGRRFRASLHEAGILEADDNGWGNKLHASLGGRRVMDWTVQAARDSGLPVVVHEGQSFAGMGDSIAAAVRAQAQAPGWLILPADLPLIQPSTIAQVAAGLQAARVVVPMWQGQRAHPVGFDAACGEALMALTGESGAAAVVRRFGAQALPVSDVGVAQDIDTWAALLDARRVWAARH
jgi:molybdenum cofactor cytidylyltransferase